MKIVISTGGTGGHIYPAISLAKYMQSNVENIEILFTGSNKHMEKDLVVDAGFKFFGYSVSSGSKSKLHQLKQYVQLAFSLVKMYFKFLFNRPDVVIGFGAYITAPTLLAAKFLNIPIILHEQNSSIGKTNEMFYKHAVATIVCYPNLYKQLNLDTVYLLGNPRATEVKDLKRNDQVLVELGLNPDIKTVLVVMGSLGSETVNQAMCDLIPSLANKNYQLLMVTGKKHYDAFSLMETVDNVKIVPYVDQAPVLASVDLVVARGGATTAAEICALGTPSIIIPSPYVSNNHQYINAIELEKVNATVIIKEEDLTAEILIDKMDSIISDDNKLEEMRKGALSLAKPNACENITNLIMEKISND